MYITVLGPPGSGKSTQCNLISQQFNIPKISLGDILRNLINNNDNDNDYIKNNINNGNLVNLNLIYSLLNKRFKENDIYQGYLLDGFPRSYEQAKLINKINMPPLKLVLILTLKKSIIIDRLCGRIIHLNSGRIYHDKYYPPKIKGIDDLTHQTLIKRKDDNINIIYQRINFFYKKIKFIRNYLKSKFHNLNYKYIDVNNNNIQKINQKINKIINQLKKNKL